MRKWALIALLLLAGCQSAPVTEACGGLHTVRPDGTVVCTGGVPNPNQSDDPSLSGP
jgi:uncharacterized protein YcfL